VVKATLTLSESGFVSVSEAVAYGEIKDDSITGMILPSAKERLADCVPGKLKEFFGGSGSSLEEASGSIENIPPRDTKAPSSSDATPSSSPSAEPTLDKKAVAKQNTIPLNITVQFPVLPPMTAEEKKTARSRSGQPLLIP